MSTPMVTTHAKANAKLKLTAPRNVFIDRLRICSVRGSTEKRHGAAAVAAHASTSGIRANSNIHRRGTRARSAPRVPRNRVDALASLAAEWSRKKGRVPHPNFFASVHSFLDGTANPRMSRIRFLARLRVPKHPRFEFAFGLEPIVQLTAWL